MEKLERGVRHERLYEWLVIGKNRRQKAP